MSAAELLLLWGAALGLAQVSAVEVFTPQEVSVENGTQAKLECRFTSSVVISSAASVTWSFQAEGATVPISFLYYSNGKAYPGNTPFKARISWAGDINKKDASINIANIRFQESGTYICDVKNPPDIVVTPGEIRLRVVERAHEAPRPQEGEVFVILQEIKDLFNTKFKLLENRLDGFESKLDEVRQMFTSCNQNAGAVEEK